MSTIGYVIAGLGVVFFVGICIYSMLHPRSPEDQAYIDQEMQNW